MSRTVSKQIASGLCTGLLLAVSVPASAAVDAKLLEMLRANGSITATQHAELEAELAKEQREQAAASTAANDFKEKLGWVARTKIKGDLRLRQEMVSVEGGTGDEEDENRQRLRMRLGFYSEVNDDVDAGIRIATGSSDDRRSTNQTMGDYFDKKDIWLDLAYLDWHPGESDNLHLFGGKMPQPWVSVADVIWDGDINPEGFAATYTLPVGGLDVFANAGYFNMEDNVDGEGVEFRHDAQMYTGQLGAHFDLSDSVAFTLGGSLYAFDNETADDAASVLTQFGNTTNEFQLWEGFAQMSLKNLPVPVSVYGQYVVNTDTDSDQDTAWLAGFTADYNKLAFDYNYRDVQRDSVVSIFTDSDFAAGLTGSRGHKFKLGYDLGKNVSVGATYFMAETDSLDGFADDTSVDTLQLDLVTKF